MSPTRFSNSGKQHNKQVSVEQFATRLRKLAANCKFLDVYMETASVNHYATLSFQMPMMVCSWEGELTLDSTLTKACILESSETQAVGIEEKFTAHRPEEDIGFVKGHYKKRPNSHIYGNAHFTQNLLARVYMYSNTRRKCGKNWPHKESPCPAQGCTCMRVWKTNPLFQDV